MATSTDKPALTQADIDAAATAARTAERSRIAGITGHAEAAGRTALAAHLANNTDMSVEQAAGVMAASPKEAIPVVTTKEEAKDTNHFKNAMDKGGNPNVGGGQGGEGVEMTRSQQILAAQSKASGRKPAVIVQK